MSQNTQITLAKGGTAERQVPISKIHIPDLWHIASGIRTGAFVTSRADNADRILEVWNLAHDLRRHIQES